MDISLNVISFSSWSSVLLLMMLIVGENIHLEYEKGRTGADAAITGAYLVARPVFFAVVTTMIAFIPWLLLDGWQVQFVKKYILDSDICSSFFSFRGHFLYYLLICLI